MNWENCYCVRVLFKKQRFEIRIKTYKNDERFDLEIGTTKKISGNIFTALKQYLIDEGYIDQAREYNNTPYEIC